MIINSFEQLIRWLKESCPRNHKKAVIVMFKSQTCPPCRQTINYLSQINPNGETNWDKHASEMRSYGVNIVFFPIDARDSSVINNDSIFPIISASETIRAVPTFDVFFVNNTGHLEYIKKARHSGGLSNEEVFSTYLDMCHSYIINHI